MCGFIGVASRKNINNTFIEDADKFLICRGPDDQKWSENSLDKCKTLFSFHRLSIIDHLLRLLNQCPLKNTIQKCLIDI